MKTINKRKHFTISHLAGSFRFLLMPLACFWVMSCGLGPSGQPDSGPVTFNPTHWKKVANHPPTYFPKGTSADHPTGVSDGSWVFSGDQSGARYFIPARGLDSRRLTAEAMMTMTPKRRVVLAKGGQPDLDVDLAEGFGKTMKGFGYLLIELDQRAALARRQSGAGPMRGATGLFENSAPR